MKEKILLTGANGFIGSHILNKLLNKNYRVIALLKDNNLKLTSNYNLEIIHGDITKRETLPEKIDNLGIIINTVGIIRETKDNKFYSVHVEGVKNLLDLGLKSKIKKIIHISALGTRRGAKSKYHQTKYLGEQEIIRSNLNYTIFRPSIVLGKNCEFLKTIDELINFPFLIPLINGGKNLIQPIYVEDLVSCIVDSIENKETDYEIIEIGGAQIYSFKEMIDLFLKKRKIKKYFLPLPNFIIYPVTWLMEKFMEKPKITRDQLIMLNEDNICDNEKAEELFNIRLKKLEDFIEELI